MASGLGKRVVMRARKSVPYDPSALTKKSSSSILTTRNEHVKILRFRYASSYHSYHPHLFSTSLPLTPTASAGMHSSRTLHAFSFHLRVLTSSHDFVWMALLDLFVVDLYHTCTLGILIISCFYVVLRRAIACSTHLDKRHKRAGVVWGPTLRDSVTLHRHGSARFRSAGVAVYLELEPPSHFPLT